MSLMGKIEAAVKERMGLNPVLKALGARTSQGLPDKSVQTIALELKEQVVGSALDKYKSEHPEES